MTATLHDPRVSSVPQCSDRPTANWLSRLNSLLQPTADADSSSNADQLHIQEIRELLADLRAYSPDELIYRLDSGILSSWASAAGRRDLATSLREIERDTDDDPSRRLRTVLGMLLRELRDANGGEAGE